MNFPRDKRFVLGVAAGLCLFIMVGAATTYYAASGGSAGRKALIEVEVLDDDEWGWFRGRADLYLKVYSTVNPSVSILLPVNTGDFGGKRQITYETPFIHDGTKDETLNIELLDDDSLSADQEKLLVKAAERGCYLLYSGARIYAVEHGVSLPEIGAVISQGVGGSLAKLLIDEYGKHSYKSYGHVSYNISEIEDSARRDTNPVTVVDKHGSARVHIRVYYR